MKKQTENITATLKQIKFQNSEDFCIATFLSKKTDDYAPFAFSGLGTIKNPLQDITYQLAGSWANHSNFGKQFKFNSYRLIKPVNVKGIYKYLMKICDGVGPTIAASLVDLYQEKTLQTLKSCPELVAAEIKGLTEKKALKAKEALIWHEQEEQIMIELLGILNIPGLRKNLPSLLITKYGLSAMEELKRNPYIITEFKGTSFMVADKLALQSFKIPFDSFFRIKTAILYLIQNDLSQGNVWMPQKKLINLLKELIGPSENEKELLIKFKKAIHALIDTFKIVKNNQAWITLKKMDENETYISKQIKKML